MFNRSKGRRGANAIEFALVLPVLVMLLFGAMEYGWLFMNQIMLDASVAEGLRAASRVDPDDADPTQVAQSTAYQYWVDIGLTGTPNYTTGTSVSAGNNMITLNAALSYPDLFGGAVPSPDTLSASLTVRSEY